VDRVHNGRSMGPWTFIKPLPVDSLICGLDLMRPKGYLVSNHDRTRVNGRLRLDGGGLPWSHGRGCQSWPLPALRASIFDKGHTYSIGVKQGARFLHLRVELTYTTARILATSSSFSLCQFGFRGSEISSVMATSV
jgi:hypothetical protein